MKSFIWIVTLLFTFALPAQAAEKSCDDLSRARSLYQSGKADQAIAELKILKQKCPKSADINRLMSDMYWWQGSVPASIDEANNGLAILNPEIDAFDETKLHLADRLHPFQIRANFAELSADQSTGQDYSIEGDARIAGKQHLFFGAYRTSRIYSGNVDVSDNRIEVGHLLPFGKSGYWENSVSYSPDATIYARYTVTTIPHWVTENDFDLFLVAKFGHYNTDVLNASQVFSLAPGFSHAIGNYFTINLQEIATHSYHWLNATQGRISYLPNTRWSFDVGYSTGHVIEGPGLEGDYKSFDFGFKFRVNPCLAFIPSEEIYRGSVRNETATGITAEVRF